jgi:hypothetical protein
MVDSLLVLSLGVVWQDVILKSTRDVAILTIAFLKIVLEPYVFYEGITIPYTRQFLIHEPLLFKIPGRLEIPQLPLYMEVYMVMMVTQQRQQPVFMLGTSQRLPGMTTIRELMETVFS